MTLLKTKTSLAQRVREFVRAEFHPHFGEYGQKFQANPTWQRLRELGTELWLDTGDLDEADSLWTREFTALTTNNTLLNKEVQKGLYDQTILQAADLLEDYHLDERRRILEIAFILNARHGLKLVERFDADVSVEEHTDLANDVAGAVEYARRYHEICPERFIVKLPFTPAGLLATRILSREGIVVNHTLGFSARQNYVIARLGRPEFVNVFLGRLNAFVADNKLGSGQYVGEQATLASQAVVRNLRRERGIPTRQIGASFREGTQIRDLAGMDVMTMPPKVARGFLDLKLAPEKLVDRSHEEYEPPFEPEIDPVALRINSLWDIDEQLTEAVDTLEQEHLDSFTPNDLVASFAGYNCGDFLVEWNEVQLALSYKEGKIPKLENWRDELLRGRCALDSLMNLAGLSSFQADQRAMDDRVRNVLQGPKAQRS